MAFLFADSFDHYAIADITKKWTQVDSNGTSGDGTTIAAIGRHSTNGLKLTTNNGRTTRYMKTLLTSSGATAIVGVAFRCVNPFTTNTLGVDSEALTTSAIMNIRYQGTTQVWMRLNSTGTLSIYRSSTLLGTTSIGIIQNTFSFIELKVVISSTVGTLDVHIDGVSALSLTGLNTQGASGAAWDEFSLGKVTSSSGVVEWDFDDLYVLDGSGATSNNFLGDVRVDCIFPNAAGDETNWTPDSGSNYARVSENPFDGDTSYVAATTAATKDTYKTLAQPVAGANIFAIQVNMMARKTDAGAAGLKPVIRITGTDYLGTEQGIPSTYSDLRQIYDLNPATGVAWVDGDIGPTHAQFGIDKST